MNEKTKQKWIEELRKRKQGLGYLNRMDEESGEHKYCCIGVLVDVVYPGYWEQTLTDRDVYSFEGLSKFIAVDRAIELGLTKRIPPKARHYLEEKFPKIPSDGILVTVLYRLNDNGASFQDIAKFIEAYLETDQGGHYERIG